MALVETELTDDQVEVIQDTQDAGQDAAGAGLGGFQYSKPNEDYPKKMTRQEYRLLLRSAVSDAGRVVQDGTLTFGVRAMSWYHGDTLIEKAEADTQALTNNTTNYIYYTVAGVLTVNITGFPVPSTIPHIPLATILTAAGTYAYSDITDKRQPGFINVPGLASSGLNDLDWQESVLDEIDFTAAEPGAPTLGDRYLNTGTGASSVTAQTVAANDIEEWNGTDWTEITPDEGFITWIEDVNINKIFIAAWVAYVGTGLEQQADGSIRIAAAAAGDGLSGGAGAALALDLHELTAAAVDVANDSIGIIDAGDNSSKKESIADLATAQAGSGITATNGVFSATTGYHGEMSQLENAVATVISTADIFHPILNFVTGEVSGWTFDAGSSGAITDTANNGGVLRCTDVGHGLVTGDMITLVGMADAAHNGQTAVTRITDDVFDCDDIAFNSINDTGSWIQGSSLTAGASATGTYSANWQASIAPVVNNHIFTGTLLLNATLCTKSRSRITSGGGGAFVTMSGTGIAVIAVGDVIELSIKNVGANGNVTVRHANVNLHRI